MKYHIFQMYGANFLHQGEFETLEEARLEAGCPDCNGMQRRCMVIQGELVVSDESAKEIR